MLKLIVIILACAAAYETYGCTSDCSLTNRVCLFGPDGCSCPSGFAGPMCELDCAIDLSNETEIIINKAEPNMYCRWDNKQNTDVIVNTVSFNIGSNKILENGELKCPNDYLDLIDDGKSTTFCGADIPEQFVIKKGAFLIWLTTVTYVGTGLHFNLTYARDTTPSVTTPEVTTPASVTEREWECPLSAVEDNSRVYMHGGLERPCPRGTLFRASRCTCVHQ